MFSNPDGPQVRAARALLRWRAKDLAAHSNVSEATILKYEMVGLNGNFETQTMRRLLSTLDAAGVVFEGRGVNLKDTPQSGAA